MTLELSVFVGHSFDDSLRPGGVSTFRRSVQRAFRRVEKASPSSAGDVRFKLNFASSDFGKRLPSAIAGSLRSCDLALIDLTGWNPNVMYELGYLAALGTDVILISRHMDGPIPADISDVLIGTYDEEREIPGLITPRIREVIRAIAADAPRRGRAGHRSVWFRHPPAVVSLVCAPETEKTRFASRTDSNYLFVDNLEDRDSLLEAAIYLSRHFPTSRLNRFASDAMPSEALDGDVVALGGPGEPGGAGNHVSREVLRLTGSSIQFDDDCTYAVMRGRRFEPALDVDGRLRSDYGYFLAAPSPYNSDRRIVLACGVYTAGTLGAVMAFGDHPIARRNAAVVRASLEAKDDRELAFEAIFPVEIHAGGAPLCPAVDPSMIFAL